MTREEAIKRLKEIDIRDALQEDYDALYMAIEALDNEKILDNIRAEIEQKARPNEIGGRGSGKSIRYGLCMALEIIDKYKKGE